MSPAAYADLDHVIVTSQPDARGVIDSKLDELGLSRRIAVRVARSVLVPPLVAHTDLVAAVDAPALRLFGNALPLQTVRVDGLELLQGHVSLVWHERTHKSPEHAWMRQLLREQAAAIA